jgi:hypothetical protein
LIYKLTALIKGASLEELSKIIDNITDHYEFSKTRIPILKMISYKSRDPRNENLGIVKQAENITYLCYKTNNKKRFDDFRADLMTIEYEIIDPTIKIF